MKKPSSRLIEHVVGLLALGLALTGLLIYAIQEPQRIVQAQEAQLQRDLDEAMTLYAQNCSVCHGVAGEGIGATPPLDNPALRNSDAVTLTKIIARGLYGTTMPAWHIEDGGTLSDYQIATLVSLIPSGDWQAVQDRVVNLGLVPLVPFSAEPDPALLAAVGELPGGEALARGITVFAGQCVACHGADGLGSSIAPALNDPAVRQKPPADIERTILNGVPGTLMAAWQPVLPAEDVTALVTLITGWDTVPSGTIPEPDRPLPVTEESLALGAGLFAQNCARCHGPEGQGTGRAPALNVKGFLTDTGDLAIQQIVTLGVPGTAMPAWGDRLAEFEIQAIVGFIRLWEPTAPEVATPARGGGPWWAVNGGTSPGGRSLPSGGQVLQSQPTPTTTAVPDTQAAVDPQATTDLLATPDALAATDPLAAIQAEATPTTSHQQGGGNAGGGQHGGGQGTGTGPAWAQTTQPLPWYQALDWRAWVLVGGSTLVALSLVAWALIRLRRLPVVG
jgi:mono/diheme cytochrome c family protein